MVQCVLCVKTQITLGIDYLENAIILNVRRKQLTEERFKAWYHGALAVASLAEVFTAKTNLRKGLLLLAAGWHAHCAAEHLRDEPEIIQMCSRLRPHVCKVNGPCNGWPRKTVMFDQEHCTAAQESTRAT